ncbi:hypothetical protein [Dongia sp.]|uniref:hypothetical protein n=1 Tax=Dongia sp. TaxID=1977262 RepID=UPI003752A9DD
MGGPKSYVLSGGDVILWTEDGTIMLKASDTYDEPVALSRAEAKALSQALLALAAGDSETK